MFDPETSPPALAELRTRIDDVDSRLLSLLAERAEVVADIGEAKRSSGLVTVDPERENALLRRVLDRGAGRFPKDACVAVFQEIISGCVSLQSRVTVAYLGPAGTFTHSAARKLFGYAPVYVEAATIESVIDAVRRERASFGVIPLENSTAGPVAGVIDGLLDGGAKIRREVVMQIEHHLIGHGELSEVERVYSHPQAVAQCRDWLHHNAPRAQLVHTSSTSAAVREAREDLRSAAIGSALAGELHGLPVLAERIQDQDTNETRFVMIAPQDAKPTGEDRTTLAFTVRDDTTRGALRRVLGVFDDAGVNLTRIGSLPRRGEPWRYVFVVDAEGHREDEALAKAIIALDDHCSSVHTLGSYPRYPQD